MNHNTNNEVGNQMKTNIKEVNEHINNLNNEVARLRELWEETENVRDSWCEAYTQERDKNQKLRSAAQEVVDRWETPFWKDAEPTASVIYRLRDALAPAPEEPKNYISKPQQINPVFIYEELAPEEPTTKESSVVQPDPDHIGEANEMVPEWRELGPDEVICEGDEVQPKHHDKINGQWASVFAFEVGTPPSHHNWARYRTLRLLPKRERIPPRLDAEIEVVDDPSIYSHAEARHATADAIRYLRDEIDYLKKNQK
jgi:hypothetical protein